MFSNLSYNRFALVPEASANDTQISGAIVAEFFQTTIAIATNEGSTVIPTSLNEVLGLIDLSYVATAGADPTDTVKLSTDGIISNGTVTVTAKTEDIANGNIVVRGMLIGTALKRDLLINSPSE